jgi:uncharacterized membrane protein YkoI
MTKMGWAILASVGLALGVVPAKSAFANHDEAGENEREVPIDSIPAAAKNALLSRAAGRTILKVEQETKSGKTVYSVHVKDAKGITEITVDANGTLLREGPEEDED